MKKQMENKFNIRAGISLVLAIVILGLLPAGELYAIPVYCDCGCSDPVESLQFELVFNTDTNCACCETTELNPCEKDAVVVEEEQGVVTEKVEIFADSENKNTDLIYFDLQSNTGFDSIPIALSERIYARTSALLI